MEQYCNGWSNTGSLCTPQFIKLVSNACVVGLTISLLYYMNVTRKHLVRFLYHDVHYICLFLNAFCVVFEVIAWHYLYGTTSYVILNTLFQILAVVANTVLYAGCERSANRSLLLIPSVYYVALFVANIFEVVKMVNVFTFDDDGFLSIDVRIFISALRSTLFLSLMCVSILNVVRGKSFWRKVADRDLVNKHWTSALPSKLTFSWMDGLLVKGWKKPLEMSDIGTPATVDRCAPLAKQFDRVWAEESKRENPRLIWACLKTFKGSYIKAILMRVTGDTVMLTLPFAIAGINLYIAEVQSESDADMADAAPDATVGVSSFIKNGYVLCFVIFLTGIAQSILGRQYPYFICFWRAAHIKALLQLNIFKKSLRLASWANKDPDLTQGKILNVMSTDTNQFHMVFYFIDWLVVAPIMIVVCIVLLILEIGWPALVGISILFISFPVSGFLARRMGELQREIMFVKDRRLKVMNEMLLGMKSIKMYSWESIFEKLIVSARKEETNVIRKQMIYRTVFMFVANVVPTFMACSIFITYGEISDEPLTTATAIKTLALLTILKLPFILIPFALGALVSAQACAKRMIKYLDAPELDEHADSKVDDATYTRQSVQPFAVFENAAFAWDIAPDAAVILEDVNVSIPRGKLTIVVGEVGSGKSALVNALLMEMRLQSGKVTRNVDSSKISYASQTPWILNAPVKENILFGQPLDQERYKTVCRACCLDMDFKSLPAGDETEIGERGINLSGGQRQRVSIARAMYAYSDVVVLDDPLSALDAHVGAKLFEKGIVKFLRDDNRTVVLVTHHLQYLKDADLVIELDHGKLSYVGDHTQYEEESEFYKSFLANLAEKEEDGDVVRDIADQRKKEKLMRRESELSLSLRNKGQLVAEEEREKGAVTMKVYMVWAAAAGFSLAVTFLIVLLSNVLRLSVEFWITVWTEKQIPSWSDDTYYIVTYIMLAAGQSALVFLGALTMVFDGMRASRRLFNGMLSRIMRATPRFFDVTPLGRIINRFSNDVSNVDLRLVETIGTSYQLLTRIMCVLVMQVIASYYVGIAIIPICVLYYLVQQIYITTTREIQRLDSICKSPIMAYFSECLGGLSTIRAYLKVPDFISRMEKYIDDSSNAFILVNSAARWVGARLDFTGVLISATSALVCVMACKQTDSDGEYIISASTAGIALTLTMMMPGELNHFIRNVGLMELNMNAVERISHYAHHVPVEKDEGTLDPGKDWPESGAISFENYSGAYDDDLEAVLKDITLTIPAGKRVGICGRTGSGKSSLTIAIFRLLCCKGGRITIDGVDIASLTLQKLRETLTIIPQDPLLFAATLRYNLDPSQVVGDEEVWGALERVNLKQEIEKLDKGLDFFISESGDNFSVGQKQLLCLARAFLRNSKIIIMDEATASIDMENDENLQQVIRTVFAGRTMIVIAHRISSIADSDLILVMDEGRKAEYDTPAALSSNPKSLFSSLLTSNVL